MKKIILFVSLMLCSIAVQAQQDKIYFPVKQGNFTTYLSARPENCYDYLVQNIDSLTMKYAIYDFIDEIDFSPEDGNCFPYLTAVQQNEIVDKIENMFNQKEYIGLYDVASQLLKKLYKWDNDNDVNKRMIEIWYDKRCYVSFTISSFGRSQDYSEKAKQRLLDILEKKWTQEDITIWKVISEHSLKKNYTDSYKKDVQKIMKETNRHGENEEKYLLDSLVQDAIKKNEVEHINRPISINCILMIGGLNDKRFIPALEAMVEEYKDHKDYLKIKQACTYALAKLGVQKYLDEIYANDNINYRYLGTKEAFLKWLDWNFDWKKSWWKYNSESSSYPRPMVIMDDIFLRIKNVPKELLIPYSYSFKFDNIQWDTYDPFKDEENKEYIQKIYGLYNWIKDNPDKWELPPAQDGF